MRNPKFSHIMELLVMTLSMFLLGAWCTDELIPASLFSGSFDGNSSILEVIFAAGLVMGIFTLPILLFVRYIPSRVGVLLSSLAWVALVYYGIYVWKARPVIQEIREADTIGLLRNTTFVSVTSIYIRIWIWSLVAVLGGFYAIRKKFSYLRLIIGVVLTGLAGALLTNPFAIWPRWWLAPVCYAAFTVLLVTLPIQRSRFERLLSIRLGAGSPAPALPYSPVASLLGHLTLVMLAIAMACSAVINYFEAEQYKIVVKRDTTFPWKSPADTNAYDALKTYFKKGPGAPDITASGEPADYDKALKLDSQLSTTTRQQILDNLDRAEWNGYFQRSREFISAFETASLADYLQMDTKAGLSYLNIRETARALEIRSLMAMHESRYPDAVKDMTTMLRMGGLMRDQPLLVLQMIGVAVRNIGIRTAWNLVAMASTADQLKIIAAALDTVAPTSRVSLDYQALKLGEPGLLDGPIIPNVEIVVPGFARAHRNTLVSWMNFDLLRIATALERYRISTGGYPAQLIELSPTYLKTIPREPLEGRAYKYAKTADAGYELRNSAYQSGWKKTYATPLFMPPTRATDARTGKKIE